MTTTVNPRPATRIRRWITAASSAGLALFAYIAICSMETSAANYDPQFMRVLVERTAAFGGSYYSNGVHNKGPLEPFVYSVALHLGGANGFWFVIATFTFIAACFIGLAGAATVIVDRGSVLTMSCVMALFVAHFTISAADYAGVLYSRNMSIAFLTLSFFVGVIDAAWATPRRRKFSVLLVGLAIGLSVQTLISGVFTAAAVMLWVMWWRRRDRVWRVPVWFGLAAVAALVFLSAPLYYRVFGPWDDFKSGFWTYARYMSMGTGRTFSGQFSLGLHTLGDYYLQRPELVFPLICWVALFVIEWRYASPAQRSVRLMFIAWWGGAWIELFLSQRYSSHYFSVLAVPTMMMFADLLTMLIAALRLWQHRGAAFRDRLRPLSPLLPLVCVLGSMMVGGNSLQVDQGIQTAAMVRSADQFTERREAYMAPRVGTTHAALDLISEDGDPLLMWTSYPWPYLDLHRVSATRYIWKSFLIGEIYLGATDTRYVLPGTWENFAADLKESDPPAYLVETVTPVQVDTPFADYVEANFTPIYVDSEESLSFRNGIVEQLQAPPGDPRQVKLHSQATTQMCERVDGSLQSGSTTVIQLTDRDGGDLGRMTITANADSIDTKVHRDNYADAENHVPIVGEPKFTLIAGARSVVLMVDGRIVAAIHSERKAVLHWATVDLRGPATISSAPPVTGCGK